MKIYRIDEAARRLDLPVSVLKCLESEGRIRPRETIGDVSYFSQCDLDNLIQELHASLQRASWREMEQRMEEVEQRLEALERRQAERNEAATTRFL
ncbi:MAG: MerR family transcriptional regulator [Planctomycetes bacterium]|nr:MerR family transcriptional regulator [Planctomycetota bacterium]